MANPPVNIAILVLAHKDPTQVKQLVTQLEKDFDVFVHLDKLSRISVSDFREFARTTVTQKFKASWGSLGIVRSTLELFNLASNSGDYDRYVLISGQDVPLQTNDQIISFFYRHSDVDFVESLPYNLTDESRLTRMTHFHFFGRKAPSGSNRRWEAEISRRLDKLILLSGIRRSMYYRFRWGSQWMDLRSETVQKILEFVRTDPNFLKRFRFTFCPDEVFFQTAVENCGATALRLAPPSRFIDWDTGPEHPRVLRRGDLRRLQDSPMLFARKCDRSVDSDLIEHLYARLRQGQ